MNCYLWELEAILEGLTLKALDEQERDVIFGFNLRYILNAKKPQMRKVFDKKKQEKKLTDLFNRSKDKSKSSGKTQKVVDALNHFKNRR